MSGVDFGLPQNTNVLAVAAGRVIYARYTDSQIRNEVRIDHGGGFVTEYWDLNSIDPSIVKGVSVAQGQLLGKSGYAPCPKCKNGISVHLRLQFRHYTSNPLLTTPLSAHGMAMDGYTIWTFVKPSTGQGYNFQGTMTRGKPIIKYHSECGDTGVKTWYSLNGPTILAIANGTGGFLTSTNTNPVQTDWPMFGYNAQHTHFNPYENMLNPSNVSSLVLDWRYNTGGRLHGTSPVGVKGIVYASSYGGHHVYALNATTGAHLWSDPITSNYSPAVANGVVYFASDNNKLYSLNNLYALNATTGAYLWSYHIDYGSTPTVANGVVYIATWYGELYALDATTGAYLWRYTTPTGNSITSSPAVANGVVYIGSYDDKLYALDATTGAYLWSFTTGNGISSSPAVVNGVVYISSYDDKLYALNATTGAYLWSFTTGNGISSSPAVANGVVYIGSYDDKLYALNATTGAYLWSYTTGYSIRSSPAVANGVVYVGSDDHKLYALNATTGAYLWSYTTGSYLFSSPAVVNGVVYVGSEDNYLYAFHLPGTP
jgi:outer membrane protein assembly factor BamB